MLVRKIEGYCRRCNELVYDWAEHFESHQHREAVIEGRVPPPAMRADVGHIHPMTGPGDVHALARLLTLDGHQPARMN